tara:strand:- start:5565 stop:6929 length:1365 start_codon:yes stop_codon:yes gene_type:complete
MRIQKQTITGWGRMSPVEVEIITPKTLESIQEIISNASSYSLIPRGLGRSYGDAAQLKNGSVICLDYFNQIQFDSSNSTVTVGGGVSFGKLLELVVPRGFFLPVSPGTRNVTVGGAIAADVHGKNHHADGSFGNHISRILIVDGNGDLVELTPNEDDYSEYSKFWATVGGMGLTGVIIEATFTLIPIDTSLISVDTFRFNDLDSLMAAMIEGDSLYRYSVAWVDSLNYKGRGILTNGDHAFLEQLNQPNKDNPLYYNPQAIGGAPTFLPNGLLNKLTVRAFNEAWFRRSPKSAKGELQGIASYFHPLDGIKDWNRIYGPSGFLQYQFVVPDKGSYLISHTLEALRRVGAQSFLTVLKRFGPENPGFLSFPKPGWTLAIDLPAGSSDLLSVLCQIDEKVASAGGRIYLAKDSRQSPEVFERTYSTLAKWKSIRSSLDPKNIFSSDIAMRLNLNLE